MPTRGWETHTCGATQTPPSAPYWPHAKVTRRCLWRKHRAVLGQCQVLQRLQSHLGFFIGIHAAVPAPSKLLDWAAQGRRGRALDMGQWQRLQQLVSVCVRLSGCDLLWGLFEIGFPILFPPVLRFELRGGGRCAYLNGDGISSALCHSEKFWVCSRADSYVRWRKGTNPQ